MLYSNCKSLYSGFVYILHSVPRQFSETVVDSDEQIVVKRRKRGDFSTERIIVLAE